MATPRSTSTAQRPPCTEKGKCCTGSASRPPARHSPPAPGRSSSKGPLDAIAVTTASQGRHVGVAPSGTALTAGRVTTLNTTAGPLSARGIIVAFDSDPAGRQAALRAYPLLRAAGAWPTTADLPDGSDPASLTQHHGPAALTTALRTARPLAERVIDERLAGWAGRLDWPEGRLGAARDAARLLAALPAEHVGPQVQRLADRLGLDPATITAAVLDALTGPGVETRDANLQRPRHAGRDGISYDRSVDARRSTAHLARAGYPRGVTASALTAPATAQAPLAAPRPDRPPTLWPSTDQLRPALGAPR